MAAANVAARTASRKFWQLTQIATAVALLCAVDAAQAQDQNPDGQPAPRKLAAAPAEPIEQIVVTGSRIRGIAPVGSPVVSVGRGDIEASGAVSTAQLL